MSSLKKLFAGTAAVAIALTQAGTVFAAYSDVPSGVWFEDSVASFVEAGYLDASQTRFRGSDSATRAEFIKLVVEINGGVLGTAPAVPSFNDVAPGTWYYTYMEDAAKEGWVKGDKSCYGTKPCYARPNANINRAEAAALINRAFELDSLDAAPTFVDVPSSAWYAADVQVAADHCILQGDGGTGRVRPSDNMNRAEMVVMLDRANQDLVYGADCGTTDVTSADVQDASATSATTVEVVFTQDVDPTEAVDASRYAVTGGDAVTVQSVKKVTSDTVELTLNAALSSMTTYTVTVTDMVTDGGETFSGSADFTYSSVPASSGTLEVSLASTNPVGDVVPGGAVGVVMQSIDLTASCDEAVTVSQVVVLHEGFGESTDIDGVYATIDGVRVARRRTVDSQSQTAIVRFTKPIEVPKCKTVTVDLVADFITAAQVSAEHNFAIELPTDVISNAKSVDGTFPMRGNTFRVAAVQGGVVTVQYRTVSPDQVTVGDVSKVLGRFEVRADSAEDQTIYSVTLEQQGSVKDGDITNLKIRRNDGTIVSNTVTQTSGDFVTFLFDPPLTVREGDRNTLEVVGDIVGGAAETVKFAFDEASDLFAVGSLYGYGKNGQLYGSQINLDSTTVAADTVTIKAGQFTVEINGPMQQKYTSDQNGALLANVYMTPAGDPLNIRRMYVAISGETSSGYGLGYGSVTVGDTISENLSNVTLRNQRTGTAITGTRVVDTANSAASTPSFAIYRFDDFDVMQKDLWTLKVDFTNNSGTYSHPRDGDHFYVEICTKSYTETTGCGGDHFGTANTYNLYAQGTSTTDDVTDIRPGTLITGIEHVISAPSLTVAVQGNGTSEIGVRNAKNISLLRFTVRAGEADDILFRKASFKAASGTLSKAQNFSLWADADGVGGVETKVEEAVAVQGTGADARVSFTQFAGGSYNIPADTTIAFEVHADVASDATTGDSLRLAFATADANYVEAMQARNGSDLSGIKTDGTCSSTCEIIVTTATSKTWSFVRSGDLYVATNSTPRSRQLVEGELGQEIMDLRFTVQNEDIRVDELNFTASGSSVASVERLALFRGTETTAFAYAEASCPTAIVDDGAVHFCAKFGAETFVVNRGTPVTLLVKPQLKQDNNGAVSKETIQFKIAAPGTTTTTTGAVKATGRQSSQVLDVNDGDANNDGEVFIGIVAPAADATILSSKSVAVFTKFITVANAGATTGSATTGKRSIADFKFTASSNNTQGGYRAALSGAIFRVSMTDVAMDGGSFKIYKASDGIRTDCSAKTSTGVAIGDVEISATTYPTIYVVCSALRASGNTNREDFVVSPGSTSIFSLEADVTDVNVDGTGDKGSYVVTLEDYTDITKTTFAWNTSHIQWMDGDSSTAEKLYWIENGQPYITGTNWN